MPMKQGIMDKKILKWQGTEFSQTSLTFPLALILMDEKGSVYTYLLPKKAKAIDWHLKERDMQMCCLVVHQAVLGWLLTLVSKVFPTLMFLWFCGK